MPLPLPLHADIVDMAARVAVVQGYNSNTYQSQDRPEDRVIKRHPSPYTGLDATVELRAQNAFQDQHDLRIQARAQHYEPRLIGSDSYQPDDGTLNGTYSGRFTLDRRLFLSIAVSGTATTINGARLTEGSIFRFDPTVVRRSFWLVDAETALTYELTPVWRLRQSLGTILSGTLSEPPITLIGTRYRLEHRGFDYAQPYAETTATRDLSPRAALDFVLRYQYSYNYYVLDFTQIPTRKGDPQTFHFGTLSSGYLYHHTPELVTQSRAGFTIATASPGDEDQRPILSPLLSEEVGYQRENFTALGSVGYQYGSFNPRLGAGPTLNAGITLVGQPSRVGRWKKLELMGNVLGAHSSFISATSRTATSQSMTIRTLAASAELRYAMSRTFGLLVGYDFRVAGFETEQPNTFMPPFVRHLVFLGISGYWSTDPLIPSLTTFQIPSLPGA